ncbi:MAG: hypothetical protein K2K84_09710, partial [Muribaculaceae bacterium]|nr:hypothetical protein [Muribaculaceae bacterium]
NEVCRYISRNVIVDGTNIGLAIVEIHCDGSVSVEKFEYETGFTRWTDDIIEVNHTTNPATVQIRTLQKEHDISQ